MKSNVVFISLILILSGIMGATSIAIVSNSLGHVYLGIFDLAHLVYFLLVVAVSVLIRRVALLWQLDYTERKVERVRVEVANQFRQAELRQVEKVDRSEVYATITTGAIRMSSAGLARARMIQGAITIVFGALYIFWLSQEVVPALLMAAAVIIGIVRYMQRVLVKDLRQLNYEEITLYDYFDHMLEGFTEIKMNREKGEDLFHNYLKPA